jgi:hypothetical protein
MNNVCILIVIGVIVFAILGSIGGYDGDGRV